MEEKVYAGKLAPPPIEKAWETRKSGFMPKTFVKSARRPVNMKLLSMTSFWISRLMLSTVPGFTRPRAFLRSVKESYVSRMAVATALSVRKDKADGALAMMYQVQGDVDSGARRS
jgi:hypothetical protein